MDKNVKNKIKTIILFLVIRTVYLSLGIQVLSVEIYSVSASGGFDINYNIGKDIIAIILFLIVSLFYVCFNDNEDFNSVINEIFFVIYYIPVNVSFSLNDRTYLYCFLTNLYYVLTAVMINRASRRLNRYTAVNLRVNYKLLRFVCFVICLLLIIYKVNTNGFNVVLGFDSDTVYGNRSKYISSLGNGVLAYLFRLVVVHCAGFLAPVYLYLSLKRKYIIDGMLAVMCIISRYSLTYEKSVILWLPLVIFAYFVCEVKKCSLKRVFIHAFSYGLILLEIIYKFFSDSSIYYLIARRLMFVPAWLNGMYYSYFSCNQKIWFSRDAIFLETIIPDMYGKSHLSLISEHFFNGMTSSPNTGMFAEAYSQAGIFGICIFPVIYYVLFYFMELTYKPLGKGIEFVSAGIIAITMTNTFLLSRGTFFTIVISSAIVFFFSRQT